MNLNHVTVPALDIAAAVDFYGCLGLELILRAPHYVRFRCPLGESTLSAHLALAHDFASRRPVIYFEVSRLDETVRELQRKGIPLLQEPRDEPWPWHEARLADPSGNVVCLYWAGAHRLNPPWRIRNAPGGE
jgi:catechol 2,3-dioxygenase-like lactoylglutathione lyase family enzyme